GAYPSLSNLDQGDLRFTTDFRRVYATLLDGWLNADSTAVLKNRFEPVTFLGGAASADKPVADTKEISSPSTEEKPANPSEDKMDEKKEEMKPMMEMKPH